jgi:hypothetical protein
MSKRPVGKGEKMHPLLKTFSKGLDQFR